MDVIVSQKPVEYPDAVSFMEARIADIHAGNADETLWFLEHPSLYTAGTSAKDTDLMPDAKFPVYQTGRGGQYTYHGPGQRIVYVMLNLKKRQQHPDIKEYVSSLEGWIMRSLSTFEIIGNRREGRVGIWVDDQQKGESKIAAIGVRVRHWVTYHGISINVNPDLSHFSGIVPCGISDLGVTSMHDQGINIDMSDLDQELQRNFNAVFNPQPDLSAGH